MNKHKPLEQVAVLGHHCLGLQDFQDAGVGCKPSIYPDGTIAGCDDDNPIKIHYCPFCGTELNN